MCANFQHVTNLIDRAFLWNLCGPKDILGHFPEKEHERRTSAALAEFHGVVHPTGCSPNPGFQIVLNQKNISKSSKNPHLRSKNRQVVTSWWNLQWFLDGSCWIYELSRRSSKAYPGTACTVRFFELPQSSFGPDRIRLIKRCFLSWLRLTGLFPLDSSKIYTTNNITCFNISKWEFRHFTYLLIAK